ncbi:MAG: hypothetical protein WCO47_06570 [Methylococcus sp.]
MLLTSAEIADYLPHQGPMILVDHIIKADEHSLVGMINNHQDPSHPLRIRGYLPAISAIEMAAQCSAIHGALRASPAFSGPRRGVLALIKNISWTRPRLDDIEKPLEIDLLRLHHDPHQALYQFKLSADDDLLVSGQLAVFFKGTEASP